MNFNKCSRCGCFFVAEGNVCPNCLPKDKLEMSCLENFITENTNTELNIDDVVCSTGITSKNLNRFLGQKQFSDFASQIQKNEIL